MAWFSQLFIHPAMAALGVGLIAIPIVIHLINRLQYRKVRFAVMEFLLQSQQRNRRRVLFEQLLLLLLRILLVLLLAAIFARLILDPSQLSLLEKNETHHVVLLDDSGSMRNRWGETSAYQEGLATIKKLAAELANQEGLQTFTLVTTSQPDRTLSSFTHRQIDVSMISELEDKLETMQQECGYGRVNWTETFAALKRLIASEAGQQQVVHILSDFRAGDWQQSPTLQEEMKSLAAENTLINLVPMVPDRHENLAVTEISGQLQSAAVNVPLQLTTGIANYGLNVIENVAVRVLVNGEPVPQAISIPRIEPGETVQEAFEVVLTTPGEHAISVQIPADALESDNTRFLTLNVPDRQRVLVADGSENFTEAQFISDVLAADSSITGIDVLTIRPEALRDQNLAAFSMVYLLNVPNLPPDAVARLQEYVQAGGGIAWFLGNRVDGGFYRQLAAGNSTGNSGEGAAGEHAAGVGSPLFPVAIGQSPVELARADETNPGADLELSAHPVFEFLNAADGLLAHFVQVYRYFPVQQEQAGQLPEQTEVIGRLRNQSPLFLETRLGAGKIFAALVSAGPMEKNTELRWHNWPFDLNAPGFTVFHLELVKYLSSRQGLRPQFLINEPLRLTVNPTMHQPEVRVDPPESAGAATVIIQATYAEPAGSNGAEAAGMETARIPAAAEANAGTDLLQAEYQETRQPGVYRLSRENLSRETEVELYAYNVPVSESSLELVKPAELRTAFAGLEGLLVQDVGELEGLQRSDPGKELRTLLLLLFLGILVAEQALAYRLGYHRADQAGKTPPRSVPARGGAASRTPAREVVG